MTKRKIAKQALTYTAVIMVIGLVLILTSGWLGDYMGSNALQNQGGVMDTSEYERIMQNTTENVRSIGFIVSIISGIGLVMSGYALYNQLDDQLEVEKTEAKTSQTPLKPQ